MADSSMFWSDGNLKWTNNSNYKSFYDINNIKTETDNNVVNNTINNLTCDDVLVDLQKYTIKIMENGFPIAQIVANKFVISEILSNTIVIYTNSETPLTLIFTNDQEATCADTKITMWVNEANGCCGAKDGLFDGFIYNGWTTKSNLEYYLNNPTLLQIRQTNDTTNSYKVDFTTNIQPQLLVLVEPINNPVKNYWSGLGINKGGIDNVPNGLNLFYYKEYTDYRVYISNYYTEANDAPLIFSVDQI